MSNDLLSIILGSSVVGAVVPKLLSGLWEWATGRAKRKRNLEREVRDMLEAEQAKSFDAISALYAALRELDKRGAPRSVIDRLEARGKGKCPPGDNDE
ncbi:hypothetical protein QP405_05785 [Gleimia europaea]|uniref:hypothetical protein n=1 Tax=Gleimia europaea TaxID=66228 RepID=UPI002659F2B5|nr:hypothetical protein [Gleimia europaea]MDK7143369.1 hypothetical protein [Gleimia europaea]